MTSTAGSLASPADTPSGVQTVGIVGFGAMGSGIAQVCALAGKQVRVAELSQDQIDRDMEQITRLLNRAVDKGRLEQDARDAAFARIVPSTELSHVHDADLVIEAVTERLDVKQSVFRDLDTHCRPDAILATNTSALSVTEIASVTTRPERVCGMHFFNPVPVLPLVEIVRAERTEVGTTERAAAFAREIGKTPITCKDTPGFVVNRVLLPMMNDVANLYDQGLASAEEIDQAMVGGCNWPIGPLALADMVGIDVTVHASEALWEAYHETRMAPAPILVRMLQAGKLGRKSGEGFYRYGERG